MSQELRDCREDQPPLIQAGWFPCLLYYACAYYILHSS